MRARPPLCAGQYSLCPFSLLPPGGSSIVITALHGVRQPEAKGFSLRISRPDKMLGAVSPGDLKALLVSCRRVRLSPALWQQASVCLQQGLLRGWERGGGVGERKGSPLKAVFLGGEVQIPAATQQESGICKRAAPTRRAPNKSAD